MWITCAIRNRNSIFPLRLEEGKVNWNLGVKRLIISPFSFYPQWTWTLRIWKEIQTILLPLKGRKDVKYTFFHYSHATSTFFYLEVSCAMTVQNWSTKLIFIDLEHWLNYEGNHTLLIVSFTFWRKRTLCNFEFVFFLSFHQPHVYIYFYKLRAGSFTFW